MSIGIIPARYGASRFPGKPLVRIGSMSMIERVYRQASKAALDRVIIATDDARIEAEALRFGAEVVMTSPELDSGTARCREVIKTLGIGSDALVVNIQGDEPFIAPEQIDAVLALLQNPEVHIATLVSPAHGRDELQDPNRVKAVLDRQGRALYFSRAPIPYTREPDQSDTPAYIHLGIYGYKAATLLALEHLVPSPLEQVEKLEQLRWRENGYHIHTGLTLERPESIDTPADLEAVLKRHFL